MAGRGAELSAADGHIARVPIVLASDLEMTRY